MKRLTIPVLALANIILTLFVALSSSPSTLKTIKPILNLKGIPTIFVPNVGQLHPSVSFEINSLDKTIFFTDKEIVFAFYNRKEKSLSGQKYGSQNVLGSETEPDHSVSVLRVGFIGAGKEVKIVGGNRLPGVVNYFLGKDSSEWKTNIPTYDGIVYRNIYDGIDLSYEQESYGLKSTYTVSPWANPGQIKWKYEGGKKATINNDGGLQIVTDNGIQLTEKQPKAWQVIDGKALPVDLSYKIEDGVVSFKIGDYDLAHSLIIDPSLVFSTFLGGSQFDQGTDITLDTGNNIYVTGWTTSNNFPITNPYQGNNVGNSDIIVSKLSPNGSSLIYSTYIGGSNSDQAKAIAVDSLGNAYLTGMTNSVNFPTYNAIQPSLGGSGTNAFIVKLSPAGNALVYSSYLGFSSSEGNSIVVDSTGNVYIGGQTTGISTTPGAFQTIYGGGGNDDAFVLKINPAGNSILYSTYLGGSGYDIGTGLFIDTLGNVYISGYTNSLDYPLKNPLQSAFRGFRDAFITKLDPTLSSLIYSTYLGGSSSEEGKISVVVDNAGDAYIFGNTYSSDFPTTPGAYQTTIGGGSDAFVSKISPDGSTLLYSTYLGGSGVDSATGGIVLNTDGTVLISGLTTSTNFPLQNPLFSNYSGEGDAFITRLNSTGTGIVFSTYLGGSLGDYVTGSDRDNYGNLYIVGITASANFPLTSGVFQSSYNGLNDIFVAKISGVGPTPTPTPTPSSGPPIPSNAPVPSSFPVPSGIPTTPGPPQSLPPHPTPRGGRL